MSETKLPEAFLTRMKSELGADYPVFLSSYDNERTYGLRCNLLKKDLKAFPDEMPFSLEKISWAEEGFYYDPDERPGKNVFHEAGAYYIQEPSAMSAVTELDVTPGDVVLDMCAAPGGKSTQIAARLDGKGLLISNEIIRDRAYTLSSNMERMGVRNAVVLNESSERLAARFPSFFNKILVDAPCSGEGMFRKDETAVNEWSPENVIMCAKRQAGILDNAAACLAPGGRLVYSTCTFSRAENEDNVEAFLSRHPEMTLLSMKRLMPHIERCEGHFVAAFIKKGETVINETAYAVTERAAGKGGMKEKRASKSSHAPGISRETLFSFIKNDLGIKPGVCEELLENAEIVSVKDNIFLLPKTAFDISGLNVIRPGLMAAVDLKNRLEPAHALAMTLRPQEVERAADLDIKEASAYIAGESVACDASLKGWTPVFVNGYSLGFGKAVNGVLKNHYPKGLRMSISS